MADAVPKLTDAQVEGLARALENAQTHNELTALMQRRGLPVVTDGSKVHRMQSAFVAVQERDGCANGVLAFVGDALAPARFRSRQ